MAAESRMRISLLKFVKCVCVHPAATYIGGAFIVALSEIVYDPSMGFCWALVMLFSFSGTFIFGKELRCVCVCV